MKKEKSATTPAETSNPTLTDLVQDRVWALHPATLDEINAVLRARIENGQTVIPDPDAATSSNKNSSSEKPYKVTDGAAVIPIQGIIVKRMSFFVWFFGGSVTSLIKQAIQTALADRKVESIVLDIDSPGGSVDGTKELADFIFDARGQKPISAYANGMMASAAYWIGSAADTVTAYDTSIVGSIGVALTHFDFSAMDERIGIKRTEIYAGKYKRIASDSSPLSKEGKAYLQGIVDEFYGIFVDSVARNRGVDVETVLNKMADGKEFIGQQALKAELVDDMGTLETVILKTKEERRKTMDIKTLKAEHPDLYQEIFNLGAQSINTKELEEKAAKEEGERILGLADVQFGEEQGGKFRAVVDSGATVDQFKAIRETTPEPEKKDDQKAEILEALKKSGAENPGAGGGEETQTKDYLTQVTEYQQENKCKKSEAMAAVAARDPRAHEKWILSQQKGAALH
ncbi:signal peptide peptidase SppA [Thermodesulfobacteriota bacterium]